MSNYYMFKWLRLLVVQMFIFIFVSHLELVCIIYGFISNLFHLHMSSFNYINKTIEHIYIFHKWYLNYIIKIVRAGCLVCDSKAGDLKYLSRICDVTFFSVFYVQNTASNRSPSAARLAWCFRSWLVAGWYRVRGFSWLWDFFL